MKRSAGIALCFFLIFGEAYSQDDVLTSPYNGYVNVGMNLTMWKVGSGWENTISQFTLPITAVFTFCINLQMTIMQ
jgi:hypothetical protein